MFELIKLELKIFFKSKKNIIAILAFSILLIIIINVCNSIERSIINGQLESTEFTIESIEKNITSLNEKYSENKNIYILDGIKECEEKKLIYESKREAIKNGNILESLGADIKIDEKTIKGIEEGTIILGETKEEIENRLTKNKYTFSQNIAPIYHVTMSSYNFLIIMGKEVLPLFLIIMLFLFNGDIVSKDVDMGTYKLLLIQPISRVKVLYSKIISGIMGSIIGLFGILILFFICLGFIKGIGSPNYPMSFYNIYNNSITNIPIAKFCIYLSIVLIFIIIFYVSLATLISTLSNNSVASIGVSITMGISIFILNTQFKIAQKFAHLNPFTYNNIPNILNGTFIKDFQNVNINFRSCIICFTFFTMLNIIISTLIFKKKDVIP